MAWLFLFMVISFLPACMVMQAPEAVEEPPTVVGQVASLAGGVPAPPVAPVAVPPPMAEVSLPPAEPAPIMQVVSLAPQLPAHKPATLARPTPAQSPVQIIKEAQSASRVGPGQAGYWQVGAMHYYAYEPGTVYDIYLSPKIGTALLFPPGDHIKVGLFLPKEEFTVEEKPAGEGPHGYDVMTIHPKVEQGRYESFVLMANGRVYPLYLIVGKQGMFTVNFELPKTESAP